jgi:tetratricopeptide (TPR) repeat protein
MRLKRLFLILFISALANRGASQDLEATYVFAKEQFNLGNYQNSSLAFERVLFFDRSQTKPDVYEYLAYCNFYSGDYELASKYFDLAYFRYENSDSLMNEMLLGKVNCLLLQQKFQLALIELYNFENLEDPYFFNKVEFYLAITRFWTRDFEKSHIHFINVLDPNNQNGRKEIDMLFEQNRKTEKINPRKAKVMSMILPGLGQIYYGNAKEGVNSFLLSGGLSYLFVYYLGSFTIVESTLVIFPWLERYYKGGYRKAESLAASKKEAKYSEIFNQILNILIEDKLNIQVQAN